jgi:hypothetical protein
MPSLLMKTCKNYTYTSQLCIVSLTRMYMMASPRPNLPSPGIRVFYICKTPTAVPPPCACACATTCDPSSLHKVKVKNIIFGNKPSKVRLRSTVTYLATRYINTKCAHTLNHSVASTVEKTKSLLQPHGYAIHVYVHPEIHMQLQ